MKTKCNKALTRTLLFRIMIKTKYKNGII
jgi:hypothetical protein